ncbi:MAG: DUF3052 domain-containing protein [Chloroflexi bacterium]|nr:DUF3052 domain-containing protein [Chloroflexota bacterium]
MTGRNAGASSAGYSGTPLPRKLGIKPGARVALVGAPAGFEDLLGPTEAAVLERRDARHLAAIEDGETWDVVVYFVTRRTTIERDFAKLAGAISKAGAIWIAWPKRSSGVQTDLTENVLRDICLPSGMVDNKVCAIDDTWSGLRFVWRLEFRGTRPK